MPVKEEAKVKGVTHKTNLDKVRQKLAATSSDKRWFNLKDGDKKKVRILPPWTDKGENAGMPILTTGLHYGFKIGGDGRALPCPVFSNRGECPVCMVLDAIENEDDSDLNIIKSRIKRKIRQYANVINRENPERVFVYSAGYDAARNLWFNTLVEQAEENEYGDFTDPKEGRDAMFKREGSGPTNTKYNYRLLSAPSPIGLKGWQSMLHNLDKDVIDWMSYEEMVKHLKSNFGETLAALGMSFKTAKKAEKRKPVEESEEEEIVEEVEPEEPEEVDEEKEEVEEPESDDDESEDKDAEETDEDDDDD